MEISAALLKQIESDLGLNIPFQKGQTITIRNCWHFSTDGNSVEAMFYDESDFRAGMNRIFVVLQKYSIVILAFVLMDTHVHFVLYGAFGECNAFVHDYIRRTSQHIESRYGDTNRLDRIRVSHQNVSDDRYLKTVICYVIKNPPVGGVPYLYHQYPWSSGALYYATSSLWTSPMWTIESGRPTLIQNYSSRTIREMLNTKDYSLPTARVLDGIVYPGDYVAVKIVERIFKTPRSFNYFLSTKGESEVDSRGGDISYLSLPIQEMRQHKKEFCNRMYGESTIKKLSTSQRIRMAKAIRSQYNCSGKQVARLCGLIYDEVKDMI